MLNFGSPFSHGVEGMLVPMEEGRLGYTAAESDVMQIVDELRIAPAMD